MKTILVIEDELLIQGLLVSLLESGGYQTLCAEDGLEGLRLALDQLPDLVLTDLSLPGLDGFEVARRLSQQGLPVVAVSACSRPEDLRQIEEAGFAGYLPKPINPLSFVRDLQTWL